MEKFLMALSILCKFNTSIANSKYYEQKNNKLYGNPVIKVDRVRRVFAFTSNSEPSRETMKYLEEQKKKSKLSNALITSVDDYDLDKIADVTKGTVFSDFNGHDLNHISENTDSILISRGCPNMCLHCGADADKHVEFMPIENVDALADSMGSIKDRLGFNPFYNKSLSTPLEQVIYPFMDGDPFLYPQNIYKAIKSLYEKSGLKFWLTTAGWHPENTIAQTAAKSLAEDGDSVKGLSLSIHGFLPGINKGEQFKENYDRYIRRMANTLKELSPFVSKDKLDIILAYNKEAESSSPMSKIFSIKILKDVLTHPLMKDLKLDLAEGTRFDLDHGKCPASIGNIRIQHRQIGPIGRAKYLFVSPEDRETRQRTIAPTAQSVFYDEVMPLRLDTDGSFFANFIPDEPEFLRQGHIKTNPVILTGKKLRLPNQSLGARKSILTLEWPDLKKLKLGKFLR